MVEAGEAEEVQAYPQWRLDYAADELEPVDDAGAPSAPPEA
jgi:hypothetical protein